MIRPSFPSVAVMSVILASFVLEARSGREILEGRGSGSLSDNSSMRAFRIAQEMPRGLKEGRLKRRRSSLMRRVPILRVLAMVGSGMSGVGVYSGRMEWKVEISVVGGAFLDGIRYEDAAGLVKIFLEVAILEKLELVRCFGKVEMRRRVMSLWEGFEALLMLNILLLACIGGRLGQS